YRAINVTADAAGSTVNLSALTSFVDNYGGTTNNQDRFSTLTATHGGTVLVPALATLQGVAVTLDPTSMLALPALTAATLSQFTVSGASVTLGLVTNIDGTNLFVSGGVTLALPLVTSYTNLAPYNDEYRTLQASGAGSVLDLHNVTSVTNGT